MGNGYCLGADLRFGLTRETPFEFLLRDRVGAVVNAPVVNPFKETPLQRIPFL